ncbi:MAG: isoaspartyl peptidase/L-asparaginase [Pseudomonadota bacterium]
MTNRVDYALLIHGGAGPKPGRNYQPVSEHLDSCIRRGEALLKDGVSALDVVERMVRDLEVSGLYVAGRGAGQNTAGYVELDAAIMNGANRKAGAIAATRDLVSPVSAARRVMDATPHVMLAGDGADRFCIEQGLERVHNPDEWYRLPIGVTKEEVTSSELSHGTVGAVALDRAGHLAAATSTGGLFGKKAGRIGDTPLIGSGTWADAHVAVSCTGLGEYFIRAATAHEVSARIRHGGQDLQSAAHAALDDVKQFGGDGGLIALNATGEICLAFNSDGMKRASVVAGQKPQIAIFE